MPKYGWKIDDILFEEEVRKIYNKAKNQKIAALVSLHWLVGPRPSEIMDKQKSEIRGGIKKEDVKYTETSLTIRLATKKLGDDGAFKVRERTLVFQRQLGAATNIYMETLINYVSQLVPDSYLFPHTTRWIENNIGDLAKDAIGKKLAPYHFRHSVLTWMARNGATVDQLMHFKGARSILSVQMYLHAVPYVVKLENLRRSADMSNQGLGQPIVLDKDFVSEIKPDLPHKSHRKGH